MKILHARIDDKIAEAIKKIAEEMRVDMSTLVRRILADGVDRYATEKAVSLYRENKISIGGAANIMAVPVAEAIDIMIKHEVPLGDVSIKKLEKEMKILEEEGLM